MGTLRDNTVSVLRDLGEPDELLALASRGLAPARRPKVNSHIHLPPNFSAFESVSQAVSLAAEQGFGVLGVSNYYDYRVYADFIAQARRRGIFPLFGLEIICLIDDLLEAGTRINDPGNPGKMYICGKGITRFDEMTAEGSRLLDIIRRNDTRRMEEMTDLLRDLFAERGLSTAVDSGAVIDMVVRRHGCPRESVYLQERHVAQAFQEALFEHTSPGERLERLAAILGAESKAAGPDDSVAIQGEIRSHLMKAGKPAFVPETFVDFAQAHSLILEMGGIPCYPTLADGASEICEFEQDIDELARRIRRWNIHAVEFIPIRNEPETLARYVRRMRRAGLFVTAGTEHNTLDLLPMEPACIDGKPIPDDVREIFWEGTCVVAAHQFLTLHGRCGFVDEQGRPNPDYADDEKRIDAFRALGAAVIERYYWFGRAHHKQAEAT